MSNISRTSPLVLIVDDDSTTRLLARATLEKSGFAVAEAEDGRLALERFQALRPDLVLLDLMMPGMEGFATCRALRQLPTGKHTPILVATGMDDWSSIHRAYEAGATDFIVKPINWTILNYRVHYITRASQAFVELQRSQTRLAHAQQIAGLNYWEWHLPADEVLWSEGFAHLFGGREENLPPTMASLLKYLHPDDRGDLEQALAAARREGRPFNLDARLLLPDSSEIIVNLQAAVAVNREGRPDTISGTIQDITARLKGEEALRESKYFLQSVFDAIHDGICILDQD